MTSKSESIEGATSLGDLSKLAGGGARFDDNQSYSMTLNVLGIGEYKDIKITISWFVSFTNLMGKKVNSKGNTPEIQLNKGTSTLLDLKFELDEILLHFSREKNVIKPTLFNMYFLDDCQSLLGKTKFDLAKYVKLGLKSGKADMELPVDLEGQKVEVSINLNYSRKSVLDGFDDFVDLKEKKKVVDYEKNMDKRMEKNIMKQVRKMNKMAGFTPSAALGVQVDDSKNEE